MDQEQQQADRLTDIEEVIALSYELLDSCDECERSIAELRATLRTQVKLIARRRAHVRETLPFLQTLRDDILCPETTALAAD